MYRQFENPYSLEKKLEELKEAYQKAIESGASEEILISLHEDLTDLEQRINFAWSDDENW